MLPTLKRESISRLLPLTFARTAHKKAGGSKTHMQDSAGKRLGPKKHEGEQVDIGQIILRQRGTKWYPGTNVGIGKDHTLFALEPGYVRYYLDPFHPKRKFIGVALQREEKLPYDHFAPTHRRLGKVVLESPEAAQQEEAYMSRKETLAMPEIMAQLEQRKEKRAEKVAGFVQRVPEFIPEFAEDEKALSLAAARLLSIETHLKGGKSLEDARFYTSYVYNYEVDLQQNFRKEVSAEEAAALKQTYAEVAAKVDGAVMLDARFQLCRNLTEEEREKKKEEDIAALKALLPDRTQPANEDVRKQAMALIDDSCFSLSEQIHLKRRFLPAVLPESPAVLGDATTKKTVAITRMNVDKRRLETIYRKKEGFQRV